MKILRSLSLLASLAVLVAVISCGEEDDPIQEEEDLEAPVVSISKPADASVMTTLEETADVTVEYTVTDDVELASVTVEFESEQIEEVTSFTDFKSYSGSVVKEAVVDGEYTITVTAIDLSGKTTSATSTFTKATANPYTALDGEVLYMSFEENYANLVTEEEATVVGSPEYSEEGYDGTMAYKGAADSYLTFPTEDIASSTMTVSFWINVNAEPNRAGIVTMGPEDTENPDAQNLRTSGFRILREARGDLQIFKGNFGTGEDEHWLDGGDLATVDPTAAEWAHVAMVIDETTASFYLNGGLVASTDEHAGLSITGCDLLSIMSGAPRFTGWEHFADLSLLDELKVFNKALTESELETLTGLEFGLPTIEDPEDPGLTPIDGEDAVEVLHMSFDTDFSVTSDIELSATAVGTPTVVDGGVSGKAYSGDVDSYLTIPTDGLLTEQFSVSMWVKLDPTATRAGLISISAVNTENAEDNNLTKGLRFFREGDDLKQTFKGHIGTGDDGAWVDGTTYATFAADREDWLHVAITVGGGKSQVYLNGILAAVSSEEIAVDWTDCDIMSIGSGAPNFKAWGHLGETSLLDEVKIFNGVLTPAQIADLKAGN
ncbi:LamG-like jellyroll fold domain-containing protein [Marinoscillum pacificum]|uniref:LamG-like jellyroll fold domain-containing protein n=1 Tax=Marinoscillum pacificum TaxID=392723 RepID=UPI0021580D62|nr:LamG-like jellyroll fold domain-containing protein [Marinoscillum pacificum]